MAAAALSPPSILAMQARKEACCSRFFISWANSFQAFTKGIPAAVRRADWSKKKDSFSEDRHLLFVRQSETVRFSSTDKRSMPFSPALVRTSFFEFAKTMRSTSRPVPSTNRSEKRFILPHRIFSKPAPSSSSRRRRRSASASAADALYRCG